MSSRTFDREHLAQAVLSNEVLTPNTANAVPEHFNNSQIRVAIYALMGYEGGDIHRLDKEVLELFVQQMRHAEVPEDPSLSSLREIVVDRFGDTESYNRGAPLRKAELQVIANRTAKRRDGEWIRDGSDESGLIGRISGVIGDGGETA